MPGHDGLWLAEYVHVRWSDTAIIMATALDDVQTVLQSRRLGAVPHSHLTKAVTGRRRPTSVTCASLQPCGILRRFQAD